MRQTNLADNKRILYEFIRHNSFSNINFTSKFYDLHPKKRDISGFRKFLKVIRLRNRGLSIPEISDVIATPRNTIRHWVTLENKPAMVQLLTHLLNLGSPSLACSWVSINATRGGLFIGPWIRVPNRIKKYEDILGVLQQIGKVQEIVNRFAYVLGFLIGDATKENIPRRMRTNRRITIRLSVKFPSNLKLGEYVSYCANSLGLRMKRCKNCPAGKRNPHPFYTWQSQSSWLIHWMFHTCLGLQNYEKTTYNSIRANWILNAPPAFKIAFLQGLADSDGFVDFSCLQAGIITHPNTQLIRKILLSLSVPSKERFFSRNGLWALMISIENAHTLPIFNPIVKSYRFIQIEKIFAAYRIKGHWPIWLGAEVEKYIGKGLKGTEIVKIILDKHNIAIRTKPILKRERNGWEKIDMSRH